MSLDRSSGSGDQRPDQTPKAEHRPFPGQTDNRPAPPRPAGYRTFDEINAERTGKASGAEARADGSGPRSAGETASGGTTSGGRDRPAEARGPAARGEGITPPSPAPRDRSAARPDPASSGPPDGSGNRRPDQGGRIDRLPPRPFPGQADNRPAPPRPTGYRTFEEINTERTGNAKARPAGDHGTDRLARQETASKDASGTAKENTSGKPAAGASERSSVSPRQDRGSSQSDKSTAQARDTSGSAGKTGADQDAGHDSGGDRAERPAPVAQHDSKTVHAQDNATAPEGHRPAGSEIPSHTPDGPAAQRDGQGGILHGHSEFHGQSLDVYTDGTRWVSGDAVRAARAEAVRSGDEGQPVRERPGISDIPQMRDLGRNTVGEKEERSPGDTSDLPPTGPELVETADRGKSRLERLKNEAFQEFDDVVDSWKDETQTAQNLLSRPQPTGHGEVQVRTGPVASPDTPQPPAANLDSTTQLIAVTGVLIFQGSRWARDKVDDLKRRHDAGHG